MDFASLHELLRSTYDEMMPLCAQMTGIAKGIAGLGALFYIALRVWASIARAEAIDVFPLLRPFVLGFCIMFFPTVVLGTMNAVLSPVVQGTEMMVHQRRRSYHCRDVCRACCLSDQAVGDEDGARPHGAAVPCCRTYH